MKRRVSKRYLRKRWSYFLSQDKEGILHICDISVKDIEKKYGTPVYILVEKEIRKRIRRFLKAFPYHNLKMQYASKCNSNLEILRIIREEGGELDASSVGEIMLGLLADFEPHQITFTNLYKREDDIKFAATVGVQAITADSLEELQRIAQVGEKIHKVIDIFIRINPMIELGSYSTKHHQYGIPINNAKKAIDFAIDNPNLTLRGLHFHGSYIFTPKVYFIAAEKLFKLLSYAHGKGADIKSLDLGGGFPVSYNGKKEFIPEDMGEEFVKFFEKKCEQYNLPKLNLIFEPGKFIVANAGVGLIKIISSKRLNRTNYIITDGSTYAFLPDPLIYKCYYDILPADNLDKPRYDYYNIAGCTCDSIDIIGKKRWLPKVKAGDLLAVMDCGAYSNVMASNFNTLKKAPIIMIKEDSSMKLIRRRDRYSEMFAPELDVLKIADPNELRKYYNFFRVNIDKLWCDSNQCQK